MTYRVKKNERVLKKSFQDYRTAVPGDEEGDMDLSLLEESLLLTPWERMFANDDALNFADSPRAGMKRPHAES